MASLIAGHGHAGGSSGITGVAPKARILSIRVITDPGDPGYRKYQHEPALTVQNSLAQAINYAVARQGGRDQHVDRLRRPQPGSPQRPAERLQPQRRRAGLGGNSGRRAARLAPYSFPADYPGVISVGASARAAATANFSSDNLSVQLAAPGVNVPAQGKDGAYWLVSGTSPACALTAGVAALIKSAYPKLPAPLVARR